MHTGGCVLIFDVSHTLSQRMNRLRCVSAHGVSSGEAPVFLDDWQRCLRRSLRVHNDCSPQIDTIHSKLLTPTLRSRRRLSSPKVLFIAQAKLHILSAAVSTSPCPARIRRGRTKSGRARVEQSPHRTHCLSLPQATRQPTARFGSYAYECVALAHMGQPGDPPVSGWVVYGKGAGPTAPLTRWRSSA